MKEINSFFDKVLFDNIIRLNSDDSSGVILSLMNPPLFLIQEIKLLYSGDIDIITWIKFK